MLANFIQFIKEDRLAKVLISLSIMFTLWWMIFTDAQVFYGLTWPYLYQIVAIISGVYGLIIAWRWGGFGSVMGRAIIMFSFLALPVLARHIWQKLSLN